MPTFEQIEPLGFKGLCSCLALHSVFIVLEFIQCLKVWRIRKDVLLFYDNGHSFYYFCTRAFLNRDWLTITESWYSCQWPGRYSSWHTYPNLFANYWDNLWMEFSTILTAQLRQLIHFMPTLFKSVQGSSSRARKAWCHQCYLPKTNKEGKHSLMGQDCNVLFISVTGIVLPGGLG